MPNALLTPELLRRLEQFQLLAARRAKSSAKGERRNRARSQPETSNEQAGAGRWGRAAFGAWQKIDRGIFSKPHRADCRRRGDAQRNPAARRIGSPPGWCGGCSERFPRSRRIRAGPDGAGRTRLSGGHRPNPRARGTFPDHLRRLAIGRFRNRRHARGDLWPLSHEDLSANCPEFSPTSARVLSETRYFLLHSEFEYRSARTAFEATEASRGVGLGMSFLAPIAFVFAAAIPVVILFYLLKRKRVVKLVSSTLLWQKFLAETQASAPFQKLRKNWLLILQIILLTLAVLALTRPYFATKAKPAQLRVVILDGSASMQATDEAHSRFEKARGEALKWVDSLAGSDQMVVLQAGANTEVKQSATSEKAALRRALQACVCSDSPTRLVPALKMAESLVRDQRNAEIHLFSDGAVPELNEFENKALPLVYHRVGKGSNNLGLTALDVRANPEKAGQRAIYVSVANFSTNSQATELELLLDDHLIETRPITIPTAETSPQVFLATQSRDGVFTVRLTTKDDLAADNQASIVSLLPKPVKVLLVSRGNRLLEKALRAVSNVQLAIANDLTDAATGFDFVVLEDVTPTLWPKGNVLAIHVVNTNWLETVTSVETPPIVDWKSTHPLLRYAGFDNVQVMQSLTAQTPSWAVSLVEAPQAPLILAGELGRQRIVWIGFDILESNWPLRVSFPIFIANAVDWLNPANAKGGQLLVKAGEPFRLGLTEPVSSAQITLPSGQTKSIAMDAKASEFVFGDTFKQGTYRLRLGTNDTVFCVDLLDAAESNIKPRDELQLGKYSKVSATTLHRANMELWRYIAALALLVLLFEWWYYHRRTV